MEMLDLVCYINSILEIGFHQNAYYFACQKPAKEYDFEKPEGSKDFSY
jgi:hypothetical protein